MTLHTKISLAKSAIRIFAGFALLSGGNIALAFAGLFIIIAEIGGIIEEIVPNAYKGTQTAAPSARATKRSY